MYFPPVLRKEEDEDEEEHEIAEGEAARFSLNRRGVRLANIWQLTLALSLARSVAHCELRKHLPRRRPSLLAKFHMRHCGRRAAEPGGRRIIYL